MRVLEVVLCWVMIGLITWFIGGLFELYPMPRFPGWANPWTMFWAREVYRSFKKH